MSWLSLDDLLKEYTNKFSEAFPVYVFSGTENELKKEIGLCLQNNEPYKPDYDEDSVY